MLWPEEEQSKANVKLVVNALAAPLSIAAVFTPRTVLDASAEGVPSVHIGSVYECRIPLIIVVYTLAALIIEPAIISVFCVVLAQLQLDVPSLLPSCVGPARTSDIVTASSKYCIIVQYVAPLRYVTFR
jgi:hypothetical protein